MSRAISLDTETTGLSPEEGDRLVELAAVEMIDGVRTGREFHVYINPARDVPIAAQQVHGLTYEFLRNHPLFEEIVDEFLAFVDGAPLVAHNAGFDQKFINAELVRAGLEPIPEDRFIDSLTLARQRFPGQANSLDALCRRFNISLASRDKHGALVDARLLADVYLELNGGRQRSLDLLVGDDKASGVAAGAPVHDAPAAIRPAFSGRVIEPTAEERAAHDALLKKIANPLWLKGAA